MSRFQSVNLQAINQSKNSDNKILSITAQFMDKYIDQSIYLNQVQTRAAPQILLTNI